MLPFQDFSYRVPQHVIYLLPQLLTDLVTDEPDQVRPAYTQCALQLKARVAHAADLPSCVWQSSAWPSMVGVAKPGCTPVSGTSASLLCGCRSQNVHHWHRAS